MMKDRIVAIYSGSDWADASVCHMIVPAECDLKKSLASYREWYDSKYLPSLKKDRLEYLSFSSWLEKNHGAVDAGDSIEHFNE